MKGNAGQLRARKQYREYMASPLWRQRRERWVAEQSQAHSESPLCCFLCDNEFDPSVDDMHHNTYDWFMEEAHQDLWPMHRDCHQALHAALAKGRVRVAMRQFDKNRQQLIWLRMKFAHVPLAERRAAIAGWAARVKPGSTWHDQA